MYHKQTNKSAVKSKELIVGAMIKLMSEKPYEKITVMELCKTADVVRKTFYRNFDTKDDVWDYILDTEFDLFTYEVDINGDIYTAFLGLYAFIANYKEYLKIVHENGLMRFISQKLIQFIDSSEFFANLSPRFKKPAYYKYLGPHLSATLCTIVETWTKNDFTDTPGELAGFTELLLLGIVRQPPDNT